VVISTACASAEAGEASRGLRYTTRVFHWPIPRPLALVAAQFGDQRDHSGVDAGHQLVGSVPL
jgi:hypothetical protein